MAQQPSDEAAGGGGGGGELQGRQGGGGGRGRGRVSTELLYELQVPLPPMDWLTHPAAAPDSASAGGEAKAAAPASSRHDNAAAGADGGAGPAAAVAAGAVQQDLRIPPSARYVLSIKNPTNRRPGFPSAGPEPQYSSEQVRITVQRRGAFACCDHEAHATGYTA